MTTIADSIKDKFSGIHSSQLIGEDNPHSRQTSIVFRLG